LCASARIARRPIEIGVLIQVLGDRQNELINRQLRARLQPAADDRAEVDQLGAQDVVLLRGPVIGQPIQIGARPQIGFHLIAAAQAGHDTVGRRHCERRR
jgi:hypothetical protein